MTKVIGDKQTEQLYYLRKVNLTHSNKINILLFYTRVDNGIKTIIFKII